MNILDENIIASQRQRLRSWRIPVQQIGIDIARKGLRDPRLNTQAKRMGTVVRASHRGLGVWRLHAQEEEVMLWGAPGG
jgi:hypothetical protein